MSATITKPATGSPREIKAEVRQIRKLGRAIAASKESAIRFLASTGMHDKTGKLKPRFS